MPITVTVGSVVVPNSYILELKARYILHRDTIDSSITPKDFITDILMGDLLYWLADSAAEQLKAAVQP